MVLQIPNYELHIKSPNIGFLIINSRFVESEFRNELSKFILAIDRNENNDVKKRVNMDIP